jgi:hypothetical protein
MLLLSCSKASPSILLSPAKHQRTNNNVLAASNQALTVSHVIFSSLTTSFTPFTAPLTSPKESQSTGYVHGSFVTPQQLTTRMPFWIKDVNSTIIPPLMVSSTMTFSMTSTQLDPMHHTKMFLLNNPMALLAIPFELPRMV